MKRGDVWVLTLRPLVLAHSVARAFGRRIPTLEHRALVRHGKLVAQGFQHRFL